MKFLFFLTLLFATTIVLGAPCDGAIGENYKNPDGSLGGFVANTARVAPTVFLDASSSVCEQGKIQGYVKIKSGSWIAGSSSIEGTSEILSSRVYGSAKVYGAGKVVNSSVCQGSEINFKVSNSEYYCQTDDPEPKHPGELGDKTIVGIDSDTDGLRDDIEIWINNQTSNTPQKDFYNHRMALKQIAKNLQSNVKVKDNRDSSIEVFKETTKAFKCLQDIANTTEYEELSGELQIEFYNTMERLAVWAKLQGNINGQSVKVEEKTKFSDCNFKIKNL